MHEVELFTNEATRLAADPRVTLPVSWVPKAPVNELDLEPVPGAPPSRKKKKLLGPVPPCVRCSRAKTNEKCDPVVRPLLDKGGSAEHGKLLVVLYGYGENVSWVTERLREAGWAGLIYFDLILRCGTGEADKDHVDACRGFLAFTIKTIKPDKILTCGSYAARAVTGETSMVHATRGAWVLADLEGKRVPIVHTCHTQDASTNRFYAAAFKHEVQILLNPMWEYTERPSGTARVVQTVADCAEVAAWAHGAPWLSVDIETHGKQFKSDFRVLSLAMARTDSNVVYVFYTEALANPGVVWCMLEILKKHKLVGWNFGYDVRGIWCQWQVDLSDNILYDGNLAYRGLNAGYPADLEEVGTIYGFGAHKAEAAAELAIAKREVLDEYEAEHGDRKFKDVKGYIYSRLSPEVHVRYVAQDAYVTAVVTEDLVAKVDAHPFLGRTFHTIQMPACRKFFHMTRRGLLIDRPELRLTQTYLEQREAELTTAVTKFGIDPDKPNSIRAFFERAGLKATRLTPKARQTAKARAYALGLPGSIVLPSDLRATDKRALAALRDDHTAIADLIEYRKISKLLSANVRNIWKFIGDDGRVHPRVKQDGAVTGRDTVVDPAVHGTPGSTPEGKRYKSCFIASPGYKMIVLDFKALEPWVAAYRSGDERMLYIHQNNLDFHTETAKGIAQVAWSLSPEEVEAAILAGDPKGFRKKAKITGLATMYGIGPESLAEQIGTTKEEAIKLIDGFNELYAGYHKYTLANYAHLDVHGYVAAEVNGYTSRLRTLWSVGYPDRGRRFAAYRAAGNMPVQSAGSDYCQIAGNRVHAYFREENIDAYLLLQVHDSLVLEAREDLVPLVVHKATGFMHDFDIPLLASAEVGDSWGGAEKVDVHALTSHLH